MHSVSVGPAIELPTGSTWDKTQGRGGMDREHRAAGLAVKDIYLIHCVAMCNENFAATLLGVGHRNWAAVAKASSGVP
jgi:hypothetical protein